MSTIGRRRQAATVVRAESACVSSFSAQAGTSFRPESAKCLDFSGDRCVASHCPILWRVHHRVAGSAPGRIHLGKSYGYVVCGAGSDWRPLAFHASLQTAVAHALLVQNERITAAEVDKTLLDYLVGRPMVPVDELGRVRPIQNWASACCVVDRGRFSVVTFIDPSDITFA